MTVQDHRQILRCSSFLTLQKFLGFFLNSEKTIRPFLDFLYKLKTALRLLGKVPGLYLATFVKSETHTVIFKIHPKVKSKKKIVVMFRRPQLKTALHNDCT